MSLDSLLDKLIRDVTDVTDVQASKGKDFSCNGTETAHVSGVTAKAKDLDSVTVVTARISADVTRKPAPVQACTAATAETSQKAQRPDERPKVGAGDTATSQEQAFTAQKQHPGGADTVVSAGWRLHYADRDPQSIVTLAATHDEILARYPDAIAAEPFEIGAGETVTANQEPFDREAFEERAAICEFDGGLSRDEAEAVAWHEDDRRRCRHCLNLSSKGVCSVASPKGPVIANRGYRPVDILKRCEGYRPCPDDPDRRGGMERWSGLFMQGVK